MLDNCYETVKKTPIEFILISTFFSPTRFPPYALLIPLSESAVSHPSALVCFLLSVFHWHPGFKTTIVISNFHICHGLLCILCPCLVKMFFFVCFFFFLSENILQLQQYETHHMKQTKLCVADGRKTYYSNVTQSEIQA